jgi:hypothetical protein
VDRCAYSTFTQNRRFLRYWRLVGCRPRDSKRNLRGFVGCGSNQFFGSKIVIARPCAIATTEASETTIFR